MQQDVNTIELSGKLKGRGRKRLQETFRSFLNELEDPAHASGSGKELLETEVLSIMRKEGFSDKQVYDMPLKKLLDLFYEAYLWKANKTLSKATIDNFVNKLHRILG